MKTGKKKKYFFNVTGLVLVALWVVMIGLLVKKVHFRNKTAMGDSVLKAGTIDSYQREWKEIYFKDQKVGYSVNVIKPFEKGYYIQEEIFLKLSKFKL